MSTPILALARLPRLLPCFRTFAHACAVASLLAISGLAVAQQPVSAPPAVASPAASPAAQAPADLLASEMYTLPNGLTVLLHVDRALPVAGVNLWYKVGARNEPKGRSGFAHLFEHLMFMGTRRVPGSEFDTLMETGGGSNNASTSLDRTNYFSNGPSHILPLLLWLEADRLEDVGATMTKEKLDLQRDVVRNEIRQNVENTPYARGYELSYRLMYPEGHPYHNGVYGSHADLEASTTNDVKDFFATFYTPENCTLVVAGDFDPIRIKAMISDLFGTIRRGNAAPQSKAVPEAKLNSVIRSTLLDKVSLPRVQLMFHGPGMYTADDAAITLACLLLADGQSSPLYKRLVVQEKLAVEVFAFPDGAALGSIIRIDALCKPDADLTKVESIIREELAALIAAGPDAAELANRKTQYELALVSGLQSVAARADMINQLLYAYGKPGTLSGEIARYRNVTAGSLQAAAARWFTPEANLVMRILPDVVSAPQPSTLREGRPPDFAPPDFSPPMPQIGMLGASAGGPAHWHYARPSVPLVSMAAVYRIGTPLDNAAKAGRASLLAEMLREGAGPYDGAALAAALQAAGGTLSTYATTDMLHIGIEGLAANADKLAALLTTIITAPRLELADFARVKANHLSTLSQQAEEPQIVGPRAAARMLWADGNPFAISTMGTLATVPTITLEDVVSLRATLLRPSHLTLITAGSIKAEAAASALAALASDAGLPTVPPSEPSKANFNPSANAGKVFMINRPGAVQTVLAFAGPAIKADDQATVDLELASTILGGTFTSRLNANLREKNGYTYGARSRFADTRMLGWVTAGSAVKAEVTGAALAEFNKELDAITKGDISPAELTKARETFIGDTASSYSTVGGLTAAGVSAVTSGLPANTPAIQLGKARSARPSNVSQAAKYFDRSRGVLVLVGDAALIREQLKAISITNIIEIDADGKPVPISAAVTPSGTPSGTPPGAPPATAPGIRGENAPGK